MQSTIKRRLATVGVAAALALGGALFASPIASAAQLAPLSTDPAYFTIVDKDLNVIPENTTPVVKPQMGKIILVDPGKWNLPVERFSYTWQRVNKTTGAATNLTGCGTTNLTHIPYTVTCRDYVPVLTDINSYIRVNITAHPANAADTAATISLTTTATVIGVNPALTEPMTAAMYKPAAQGGLPEIWGDIWTTAYGWMDNSPPSGNISGGSGTGNETSYPNQTAVRGIHLRAGGTGTYEDPVTFAIGNSVLPYGTIVYIPWYGKYFIHEDSCGACGRDYSGGRTSMPDPDFPNGWLLAPGTDGGPAMIHFDPWIDGRYGDWPDVMACEMALTKYNPDGSPMFFPYILNAQPNHPVNETPIFENATSSCNGEYVGWDNSVTPKQPLKDADGVPLMKEGIGENLVDVLTVGPIIQKLPPAGLGLATDAPGVGLCLTDPGNSKTIGTKLTLEPCDGGTHQNFTFSGAGGGVYINNLCVDASNGLGTSINPRTLTLQRCNQNQQQQWLEHPEGTFGNLGGAGGMCSIDGINLIGGAAVSGGSAVNDGYCHWDYTHSGGQKDQEIIVTVSDTAIKPGAKIQVSGKGQSTPGAILFLVSEDGTYVEELIDVIADYFGEFTVEVTIPANLPNGKYQIEVVGYRGEEDKNGKPIIGIVPKTDPAFDGLSTAIYAQSQLPTTGGAVPDNFRKVDRSKPMVGLSVFMTYTDPKGPGADTGGAATTGSPWLPIAGLALGSGLVLAIGLGLARRRSSES
jgi:hypothetical protein